MLILMNNNDQLNKHKAMKVNALTLDGLTEYLAQQQNNKKPIVTIYNMTTREECECQITMDLATDDE